MAFCSVYYSLFIIDVRITLKNSLKNSAEFNRVFKNGRSFANRLLVMYVCKNDLDINRLGISVSKKVGNSVVRHRSTRLIRESYRLSINMFNSGLDIVVIARAGIKEAGFFEVRDALLHLARLHKII